MHAKGRRPFAAISCILLVLSAGLTGWRYTAEPGAYYAPSGEEADLTQLLQKEKPDDGVYRTLLAQAGLGRPAVDALWDAPDGKQEILRLQAAYFASAHFLCQPNSPISFEERVTGAAGEEARSTDIVGIQAGDILLTPCSHTFGWRNGHAALVVDPVGRRTLESVVLGSKSSIQDLSKWEGYPQFAVLRLRDASMATRAQAAAWAMQHLVGIPYDFTVGVLHPKQPGETGITGTQCAHLVWLAYKAAGYDIDSNGGRVVLPRDIARSPLLEVVQVYGVDPSLLPQ